MEDSIKEIENAIFALRSQIEEAKKIEASLTSQIQEKKDICQRKELEILRGFGKDNFPVENKFKV